MNKESRYSRPDLPEAITKATFYLFLNAFLIFSVPACAREIAGKRIPQMCDSEDPAKCFPIENLTEVEVVFRTMNFECIVDGDTFVADGKKIRLWGIDAPEKGDTYYTAAKIFLETMINDGELTCKTVDVDRYQRDVMHCFIDGARYRIHDGADGHGEGLSQIQRRLLPIRARPCQTGRTRDLEGYEAGSIRACHVSDGCQKMPGWQ